MKLEKINQTFIINSGQEIHVFSISFLKDRRTFAIKKNIVLKFCAKIGLAIITAYKILKVTEL